jgi:hypothetical protein
MNTKSKTLISAAKKGVVAETRRFLRNGYDPNGRDTDGMTALIWAAKKGHVKLVEVLIDHGADPNARDPSGQTALHHAVMGKHRKVIHGLVEGKADVNARDHDDCSPFDLAVVAEDYETAKYLSDVGAKDEPPDPGVLSIDLSPASHSHPPVQETIELLSLRLSELPTHNLWGRKGHLRLTFVIPGTRSSEFDGIRKKPLSKKRRMLEVQATIPKSLTKKRPMEFLLKCVNEAVDLAEPIFRRARIEFPASAIREHLDAIGVMKNWEFPDFQELNPSEM